MELYNLIIEVTRKCNMSCEHCLRGNFQNKNIKPETIEKFIIDNDINYISTITFTGGEPSLNTQAIKDFISICKNNNVEIGSFYIATNGKTENMDFLHTLIDLYCFCTDNECSQVQVSQSDYHQEQNEEWIKKLETLKFVSKRENIGYKNIISEGKGKKLNEYNGTIDNARKIDIPSLDLENQEDIYLNVKGDICTSCDLSYTRQDRNKLGNIYKSTLIEMETNQKGRV